MAEAKLSSQELSTFFESVALMQAVGVQTDESVFMLAESADESTLRTVSLEAYARLVKGERLSAAMQACGQFPAYAVSLVQAGERTGRTEDTLRKLADYYREEDRLFAKVRTSIGYPCLLLCVLSVILAFTVSAILPTFMGVYDSMAGGLAASSGGLANAGVVIGWAVLVLTLAMTVLALVAWGASRTPQGQSRLMGVLSRLPVAREAFWNLALSRFTSSLSVYTAAGETVDAAVGRALEGVENDQLRRKVQEAYDALCDPVRGVGLVQAFAQAEIFDAQHGRALAFGLRSGRVDDVLAELSQGFFDQAVDGFDRLVDKVEPALAGFVTVAVGATLIAVMLPLVGMMGSIG